MSKTVFFSLGSNLGDRERNLKKACEMLAAMEGHTDTVQALLAKGADVNTKGSKGFTALMLAAYEGRTDTVQALLGKGVDVNAKSKNGFTALIAAKEKGHNEIVRILKEAGAKE